MKHADTFIAFLTSRRSLTFFLTAAPGNSGDLLLQKGLTEYLHDHGFALTGRASEADIILMHGGGSIDDVWGTGTAHLLALLEAHPDTTVVVAPSTYHFRTTDFASLLRRYRQDIYLFARESRSLKRLQGSALPRNVHTGAAHDTAFLLSGSAFLTDLKAQCRQEYALVALRTDRESTRLPFELLPYRSGALERTKRWYVSRLFERFRRAQGVAAPYRVEDVSYDDFDTFLTKVAHAGVIHTDRLHVGILGALLEKEVQLYPTRYDKVEGVYEQTLHRYPNVVACF